MPRIVLIYSARKASNGCRRAAFMAGITPKINAVNKATAKAENTAQLGNITGKSG